VDVVIELPPTRHGAYLRDDLTREVGASCVRALVNTGRLLVVTRKVLVDRTRQLDPSTRAAAALLACGDRAVLTSHTAAWLAGCTAASIGRIHVLTGYDRRIRRLPGVVVHQGSYDDGDVTERDGLRTIVLDHALAELACRAPRRTAIACLDQGIALTPADGRAELRAEVAARIAARADPRGRRRAEILLDLASGLAESPAESWLLLDLFDAGLPVPAQQVSVRDHTGRERFRLDFAWEEVRVAVEYDGRAAHVGRVAEDEARDAELRRWGWTVLRADAADLRRPARLHAEIRSAFTRQGFAA
jgi:uncharacterized protein DUF559